jgi:hypothetical protein
VTTEKRSSDSIKFLKITMVCSRCSHLWKKHCFLSALLCPWYYHVKRTKSKS